MVKQSWIFSEKQA